MRIVTLAERKAKEADRRRRAVADLRDVLTDYARREGAGAGMSDARPRVMAALGAAIHVLRAT